MSSANQITPPPQWTSRRAFQIYCLLTVLFYVIGVAFLAILKFTTHLVDALSTLELFYGPALTIASAWIIGLIVAALMPAHLTQDDARGRRFASVLFTIILLAIGVTFLAVHFVIFRQTSASAFINHPEFYYNRFVIRDDGGQFDKDVTLMVGFWSYFTAIGGLASVLWGLARIFLGFKSKRQHPLGHPSP